MYRTLRTGKDLASRAMSYLFLLPLWRRLRWDKWDSSVPYNWTIPWYYRDVTRFVREHQLEGLKPDLWKPKTVHKLIRAKNTMEEIPGLAAGSAEVVWRNVSSDQLINGHKNMSWMAIQGGLAVRAFMHARNLSKTRNCPRSPFKKETTHHLYWECPFAQGLLPWKLNCRTLCPGATFLTIQCFMACSRESTERVTVRRPGALWALPINQKKTKVMVF
ncbi:uncharacterized protein LOC142217927 [Leptodactylus fuscus]|uniref:uncharacterized protein LOC142217927 n=1 Tax=Leptodactylus fuscus TaxID=238119 RepID=UPI003F4F287D